jgi:hypothetical protein
LIVVSEPESAALALKQEEVPVVSPMEGPPSVSAEQEPQSSQGPIDLPAMLAACFDEESRMDDFLMKGARRSKEAVHLIRLLGLVGELCHDGIAEELAEFLNASDETTNPEYVRAIIEAIGAIDFYSPGIAQAIKRFADAKYAASVQQAALAALSRFSAKLKTNGKE